MPLDFKLLSMMELRSSPGEVLDRVAHKGEAFIVERNGYQMACLVPLSVLMPDVQQARLTHEFDRLRQNGQEHTTSISDRQEVELHFRGEGLEKEITVTILLPHGYPNACPQVFAAPLPDRCPHRWQDGSLCIFGAMELWNPGQHDILHVLNLTRRWLSHLAVWQQTGEWDEDAKDG
jgi:hypothetical protein